jgi:hypothetical protein
MSQRGIIDPIAAADLSRIRAADAVLAAALAWEHATNGRPLSEQERRLRDSVRAMVSTLRIETVATDEKSHGTNPVEAR